MSGMFAIVKKELKTYFYSPLAYVILGVFLLIMGVIFSQFVAHYQQYNASHQLGYSQSITLEKLALYLYQNMAFILCFVTPFLTMKLFSEEKRQKTLELLLTVPLSGFQLVMGKFLAAFILMASMIGITFVYVFFMILWGNPELTVILSTYLGLLLAMACYVGLGTFVSAFTESQAIAAVFTFVLLILLWLLQAMAEGVTATTGPIEWGPVLRYVSPLGHWNSFAEGLIQVKDFVYFVTFTGFTLFLTHRVVESHRWR